jgi:hypothetical protein
MQRGTTLHPTYSPSQLQRPIVHPVTSSSGNSALRDQLDEYRRSQEAQAYGYRRIEEQLTKLEERIVEIEKRLN